MPVLTRVEKAFQLVSGRNLLSQLQDKRADNYAENNFRIRLNDKHGSNVERSALT